MDLQDLGYETSGKSEQDREECSSTGRVLETDFACLSVEWALISNVDLLSAWGMNKGNCNNVSYLEMRFLSVITSPCRMVSVRDCSALFSKSRMFSLWRLGGCIN